MPKLKPLEQWICDTCGELIKKPHDGAVVWITEMVKGTLKAHSFQIVHATQRCDHGEGSQLPIEDCIGPGGIALLLSKIDMGSFHQPDYTEPHVGDFRNWTEVFRRLHLPYYEEARGCFGRGSFDSDYSGTSERTLYLPQTLKQIIEEYGY